MKMMILKTMKQEKTIPLIKGLSETDMNYSYGTQITTCKRDCPNRKVGCHSTCIAYNKAKKLAEQEHKKILKKKKKERDTFYATYKR